MWRITFRYNGRKTGARQKSERTIEPHELDNILEIIRQMSVEAVKAEGAIFMRGYTVDWIDVYDD